MKDTDSSKSRKIKYDQERSNPCLREQNLTFKCYDKHNYNKEKCENQINNYKLCKSFWGHIRTQRKREGIIPHLPEPEERERIKAEFFEEYLKQSS
ncbi:hypothetical protein ILUMI_20943 [Ignelater luminosus]|uniref:Coiled-coil-helix-coiled-coil-helix domain-containing protein 7 n=1 Tax=Ignelater luminosus TaxID=2038154 RepID=A0A8K0G450_IGNLU|nr:hypothetical protein ILUMI_20943 [Ignelater luminosus]